jgi:hypothetical protein
MGLCITAPVVRFKNTRYNVTRLALTLGLVKAMLSVSFRPLMLIDSLPTLTSKSSVTPPNCRKSPLAINVLPVDVAVFTCISYGPLHRYAGTGKSN